MGIEDEADRTLFIRNLDTRVTEELLFELFLQAGPLIRTKIPKDSDGKQKTFGFAVYKHEVSVPYAMQLLNGTSLYGKTIQVQFRTGSSHSSPGNSQNSSPANTPNPHGQRMPVHFSSPPYTPPHQMQRSFSSPDSLPKHVMRNNMWQQHHMQQLEQLNGAFSKSFQRQSPAVGNSGREELRQQDGDHYRHDRSQMNSGGRSQRHWDEHGSGRHQQHSHSRENYHHQNDRSSGNRHHDSRGGNGRDEWAGNRGLKEYAHRWRRY
ncbi:RNA-binding protein 7 [Poecilia latipinna]|uniref:RNA binding motif protein 7 n=1 Tax=Poecilia latipinna TaxID=48699 RepID=A0A3B3VHC4_9TELE|nr:PREDICTED: RNA-binding protein 7-like [Poecilia latipinna]